MKKLVLCLMVVMMFISCSERNLNTENVDQAINNQVNIDINNEAINEADNDVEEERGKLIISSLDSIDDAIAMMTLEEKAGQMIQAERGGIQLSEISKYNIGSILSGGGSAPNDNSPEGWITLYNRMQRVSRNSSSGIPLIYGIDAVHGHNNVQGAVLFPHNIGLGAANNENLMKDIGRAVGHDMNATGLNWNFAPAISVVQDIRWGRSYEGFSEETSIVANLGRAYIEGIQDTGIIATTKHFIGDGYTSFGTGEGSNPLDRGDVIVSKDALLEVYLPAYEQAIEAGTKSIMVSFNSVNGVKMHANKELLTDLLKNEMGFEGVLVSDWEAIHALPGDLKNQVALSINAGVDVLMQPYNWKDVYDKIIENVQDGTISQARIDDAVKRILVMKYHAGLFIENFEKDAGDFSNEAVKAVAREAVSQSLVLLKNDNVLPLKSGAKIYLLGPASDNVGIQSGGWSLSWQGDMIADLNGGISLKDAFEATDCTLVSSADQADLIVLAIGEKPYAEMNGDTDDLSLDSKTALDQNMKAIKEANESGKKVITILMSGRPMLVDDYLKDWDAFVMAWLPGTEANGITDVLFGKKNFVGKLPVTWPKENSHADASIIQKSYQADDYQFPFSYGLRYE